MILKTYERQKYIDINSSLAFYEFSSYLYELIKKNLLKLYDSIVFVCIGTDRSTGDSLGPLVGYKIGKFKYKNVSLYGTLDNPVHAKNIDEVMSRIKALGNPLIIAVDACLGKMEHVGYICMGEGSLKPGAGVNKDLAPVGDIYITGIVNFGGFMDFLVLQNTRLSLVMKMADMISMGIKYVMWKINNELMYADSYMDIKL